MELTPLEKYYGKFKEDHRLTTRHGTVEFTTSMKYIHDFIPAGQKVRILDVGAGTGRYSVALCDEGHDVTAVELVRHNLEILRAKHRPVKTWQGNAVSLSFLEDNSFDITLLFGPMYHLHGDGDKLRAFSEARRVTRKGGIIMAAYVMNEYSVISYCFSENRISEIIARGGLTADYHTVCTEDDLYDYVRLEDINRLNSAAGLERVKIVAADGPSDYMRRTLNAMTEETFSKFMDYHLATCERPELLGASSHLLDILRN